MKQFNTYEHYPVLTVILSNLVSFIIYAIGAYIIFQFCPLWMAFYLIYILILEIRLLKESCVNCYYHGKYCAFGKGKLSALLFKKGTTETFLKKEVTWLALLPDLLVSLVPLLLGIALLLIDFSWLALSLMITLVILTTVGNGFVRSNLACKFCRQRTIGCPAEQLFNK